MSRIRVHTLPILEDNYCFLVEETQARSCLIVDPGESARVVAGIRERGVTPAAIWITHHHADHIDGIAGLLQEFGPLPVVGPGADRHRIAALTEFVSPGDTLTWGEDTVQVLAVPGHTHNHIAYYFPSGHVFSGDLLFGYSCGKAFEGTLEQMYESVSKLLQLPDETLIYCGHEYTLNNSRFAAAVEPENADLKQRIATETKPPTVPLKLAQEKRTNPFLRVDQESVQRFTGKTAPAEVFAELRRRKDAF
jgi:hydroxyacylglutathione hydrolase